MQEKKLLCYMDFAVHTGFASVAHNLLDRLLGWFEEKNVVVSVCATNFTGKPFWYNGKNGGRAYVRSAKDYAKNMNDLWYRDGFLKLLNEKNWDIVWVMNDIPVMSPTMSVLNDIRHKFKYANKQTQFKAVLYTPIDSPVNEEFMNDLSFWDKLVTYTEYGKKQIEPYVSFSGYKIKVINHGVNTQDFYPIENFDKKQAREKWKLPTESFIFGNINKNNSRKNIGGTLLAFQRMLAWYEKNKKEYNYNRQPALYLHMSPTDSTGINIYRAAKSLNIEKYLYYPTKEEYIKGGAYTLEEMNEIYNCLDCYITTTGAEGWGLTVTEAMAVQLPVIAPMHTSIKEITDNGEACYPITNMNDHIQIADYENIRHIPNVNETAHVMAKAYSDIVVNQFPHRAAQKDMVAMFDWDNIAEQWKSVFEDLL
jgi:glycosyltransferase involved in cell wall biosynthesis